MKVIMCILLQFMGTIEVKSTNDDMFRVADNHRKNILMKCVSVLSSTATGRIPIG